MADTGEPYGKPPFERGPVKYFSSFGARLGALVIDVCILIPSLWYIDLLQVRDGSVFQLTNQGLLAIFVYFVALEGSPLKASVGKLLTSQVVTDEYGDPLTLMHTIGRNLAKLLTLFTLMAGFLTILFTKRGQAVHDLVARTCVMTEHEVLRT